MQGIKFNAQGVAGTQSGLKTNTRRPIKDVNLDSVSYAGGIVTGSDIDGGYFIYSIEEFIKIYSKYKVGEVLFVQEEFFLGISIHYRADNIKSTNDIIDSIGMDWRPASEMTAEQSRCKIRINGIKVEKLQDISIKDAIKEGIGEPIGYENHLECFQRTVWEKLPYPKRYQWEANPYVFAYEFEVVK